jgi:hypothetical protein
MFSITTGNLGEIIMSKQSNDPFSLTFSFLAGQHPGHHEEYPLNHIEPLPDDAAALMTASAPKKMRFAALLIQLLALLQLR